MSNPYRDSDKKPVEPVKYNIQVATVVLTCFQSGETITHEFEFVGKLDREISETTGFNYSYRTVVKQAKTVAKEFLNRDQRFLFYNDRNNILTAIRADSIIKATITSEDYFVDENEKPI